MGISQHETRGQISHRHHRLTDSPLDSEWAHYWMMSDDAVLLLLKTP